MARKWEKLHKAFVLKLEYPSILKLGHELLVSVVKFINTIEPVDENKQTFHLSWTGEKILRWKST